MNILKAISIAVAWVLAVAPVAAQTGRPLPPPGPYQELRIPLPIPAHPHPQWNNILPLPYWMQSRPLPPVQAPAPVARTPNNGHGPAYPAAPQGQQWGQRPVAPNWGRAPYGQAYQGQPRMGGQYPQSYSAYSGAPNRYYGQGPSFFPNGPWGGFFGPTNPIYGYQPARPAPARPQLWKGRKSR